MEKLSSTWISKFRLGGSQAVGLGNSWEFPRTNHSIATSTGPQAHLPEAHTFANPRLVVIECGVGKNGTIFYSCTVIDIFLDDGCNFQGWWAL